MKNSFYHLSSGSSGDLSSSWEPEVKRFGHAEDPSSSSLATVKPIKHPISGPECEIYGNFGHFDSGIENTESVSEQKISNVTNVQHNVTDDESKMCHLNTREFTLPRRNISYFFALSGNEIKF